MRDAYPQNIYVQIYIYIYVYIYMYISMCVCAHMERYFDKHMHDRDT